ncbi:hypothetical protein Glove_82g4 [Diversispora epigaea]|uniref:Integrase core domain-containing protein n=1 Tax=Diversispora epigaea TaxID=1348612 RepID=A0A397JHD8_9GLOM|nr:hypothetical protein Glove_82g4 [Diversispora epigaea]
MNNNQGTQENIFQFASRIIDDARNAFINFEDSDYIQTHIDQIERLHIMFNYLLISIESNNPRYSLILHQLSLTNNIQENLEIALSQEGYTWTEIAKMLNVSSKTITRRRNELNIKVEKIYTILSNDELDCALKESLRRIDPFGITACYAEIIPRRKYQVSGPNVLWHIDRNHKLIYWKFVIHGAIDSYSRIITYLHCSTNNQVQTVLKSFLNAIENYGVPSKVCGNCGGENVAVAEWMLISKELDCGSYIGG